eukprot:11160481-Lingulodinium_polyedra.AAC.1
MFTEQDAGQPNLETADDLKEQPKLAELNIEAEAAHAVGAEANEEAKAQWSRAGTFELERWRGQVNQMLLQ